MREIRLAVVVALALFAFPVLSTPAYASGGSDTSFARTYSGPAGFVATSVRQTIEGGFIVAGFTSSSTRVQTWLLRLDSTGAVVWQKGYAANVCSICSAQSATSPRHAVQTPDGGFVVESTANISSTISPIRIATLVFKVDSAGSLVWQKAFTGNGIAAGTSIDLTSDGGIVVAGETCGSSVSCSLTVPPVGLILRLSSAGDLLWEKVYTGFAGFDFSIRQTSDRGFIAAGLTSGGAELLRLNSDGSILWQKNYTGIAALLSVQQTSDGGFVAAGAVPGTTSPVGGLLVLRLDPTGAPVWEKNYGGNGDAAETIEQTSDGGFIVAGLTGFPTSSASVLRLDSSGSIVWQTAFSGGVALSVEQVADGGFVVGGPTSISSMLTEAGALVFKLNSNGEIHPCKDLSKTSLATTTLSTSATSITGGSPVDITATSPGITTTFTSTDTSATSTVLCHHGFKQ